VRGHGQATVVTFQDIVGGAQLACMYEARDQAGALLEEGGSVEEWLAELSGYGKVELTRRVSGRRPFYFCTLWRDEGGGCTGGDSTAAGAVRHCLAILRSQLYRNPAPAVERLLAEIR
jgi:hypothetical protein